MGLTDFFKNIPIKSAGDVRKFLKEKNLGEYNLIDVRQPGEYKEGHIPGAQLIPARELRSRLNELDPDKPTITY